MSSRAVFVDRDGTLIEHFDFLTDPDQVQLLPTVTSALRLLKDRGFYLVMVTNQSGVARGMLTEKKLLEIHDRLKQMLAEEGAYLDQIYYCPYHPEGAVDKYRRDSELRKPAPGMLHLAEREMELDLKQCWIVGDDDRDIEMGQKVHCRTILLKTRHSPLVRRGGATPDFQAVNLQEAANLIVRYADQPPQPDQPGTDLDKQKNTSEQSGQRDTDDHQPPDLPETKSATAKSREVITHEPLQREKIPPQKIPPDLAVFTNAQSPDAQTLPPAEELISFRRTKPQPDPDEPLPEKITEEPQTQEQNSHKQLTKTVRRHEIARRKASKHKKITDRQSTPKETDQTEQLLTQILRELKALNRRESFSDFSIPKLLAGVVQMLVFLCLIMSLWFISGRQPSPEKAQVSLLLAVVFQTLTLTLLMMRK